MNDEVRNAECGAYDEKIQRDIERIEAVIRQKAQRYRSRMGDVTFAGVEGGTVKIAPTGFWWRGPVSRIALVEGLQKELAADFPWVTKVVVVAPLQPQQQKRA